MLYGILTAITALLLAALLSALVRAPALRLGLVDRRRPRPVPLLGGAAVVVGTCLVAAAGGWTGAAPLSDTVAHLLAAGAAVAVLGLAADVWRLRTPLLLLGAAVAAAFVVPYDETGVPAGVVAVVWIACVAAAFRGLDHADGLAGTVGVLTAFGAGACAAAEMMDDLAVLLSVLAAALTGFLMHNWHPARVAFGACGSLFTGFVLACAVVLTRAGYDPVSSAAVMFALTATVSADAVLVAVSRRLVRRPSARRAPDHVAHRLRRLGLTPQGATVLLGAGTFASVLVGVLVHTGLLARTGVLWVAGAALAAVVALLRVPAVRGPRRPGGPATFRTRTGVHEARQRTGPHEVRHRTGAHDTRSRADLAGDPRSRTDLAGGRSRADPAGASGRRRTALPGPARQPGSRPDSDRRAASPQVSAPLRVRDG
ncbi:MraY family glycosyltransferase [Streptomyces tropicalis]|uniref:MraY family glycosyltransferase n=1 Tax=Streptomyces tropicalis TaxID=3034234 RepID=A0ABT6A811_9ACTN|nr:MraY family glycosyltransferase [Streptomyces tropicalis]MDF3300793.1 MraY family glycosyltransferase [Streptomyces tropicalis]